MHTDRTVFEGKGAYKRATRGQIRRSKIDTRRFESIIEKVSNRLDEDGVSTHPELQYLLCEVGPPKRRLDPVEFRAAVELHGSQTQTRQAFKQPLPGIYVGHDPKGNATSTKYRQLARFASAHLGNRARAIATEIARSLPVDGSVAECDHLRTETIAADISWPAGGAILSTRTAEGVKSRIWFTMDIEWTLPYSAYLWQHLGRSVSEGRRPVVIARKIAFSTFPLLKAVGAFGLQLHHIYTVAEPDQVAIDQAFTHFPAVFPAEDVADH